MSSTNSPFKFLDAYQQADADVFFGRKDETLDLYNALSGVKLLLVYGPSGSGKTSLVECGLRNQFSDADWYAMTIRRGANINVSFFASVNDSLSEKIETDPGSKLPVSNDLEFGPAVEKLFSEKYQPVYLLFDQFEELLISGNAEEKKAFFTALNKLVRKKAPCRVILIMREEFIGHLSEFESICPSLFQHRFRVEKMGRKSVEEVISGTLNASKYRQYFNVDDVESLTKNILSKLPDNNEEIELAHVQVFLNELWDRSMAGRSNNELPLLSSDLIHDDDDLETVLESFLKKQMKELDGRFGENSTLELLGCMISEKFTKLQVSAQSLQQQAEKTKTVFKEPVTELIKELERRRIIRSLKVGDETEYELSHDVLALVVGQNRTEEMKMRQKAGDIYKAYAEGDELLSQDTIDKLRPYEQSLEYPIVLKEKIDKSIAAIKQQREEELVKTRKRLRVVAGLLLLAVIAVGIAIWNYHLAKMAKVEALILRDSADNAAKRAIVSENKATASLNRFLLEKAARDSIEFNLLANRVNIIIDAGGCPEILLPKMDSIAVHYPKNEIIQQRMEKFKKIKCP